MKQLLLCTSLLAVTISATSANARSFRVDQLPNADGHCNFCHVDNDGGGGFNDFGAEVSMNGLSGVGSVSAQDVVWANVCSPTLDSDGDGYPNGVELGDPQCTWTIGDPNPNFTASNPGDPTQTPCGNGSIEAPLEDCDGISLGGQTCVSIGQPSGILRCNVDCTLNIDGCTGESGTNNDTDGGTNNQTSPATNSQTGPTTGAPTNNGDNNSNDTTTSDPTNPDDTHKIEPFFCDGEMNADDEYKAGAYVFIALIFTVFFRRRVFQ